MPFFVLTHVYGPNWDHARGRRAQEGWDAHAAFMDGLADEGLVVLGGPVGDGTDVMLVVEADDEETVRTRLADDPWGPAGLLEIGQIRSWTVWLDGRRRAPAA